MNFELAVQSLVDAGVDFIVIGGWSAILHGSAQVTNDLDIFFSRNPENLRRLARALAPYHPRLRDLPEDPPFLWDVKTLAANTILTLMTDIGAIDLLSEVSGLGPFESVKADAVQVSAFGRRILTLDLRSLIKSKQSAARLKDLNALRELESLLEAEDSETPGPPADEDNHGP